VEPLLSSKFCAFSAANSLGEFHSIPCRSRPHISWVVSTTLLACHFTYIPGVGVLKVEKKMEIECNRSFEEIIVIYNLLLFLLLAPSISVSALALFAS